MAYEPIQNPKWSERDALPQGDQRKIILADDFNTEFTNIETEFKRISDAQRASELASCKTGDGENVDYGFNVASVGNVQNGVWRVTFTNPINEDGVDSAGDFAGVVTPYAVNGRVVIASITDQREGWVDIAFRELQPDSNFSIPTKVGFAFILINQNAS
jgi:hypothetical protein